ncbi:MAG: chromosome partitioning protein ParB [Proteobacteria bacterium]|nr:ParB/RepB/Spo0J family partition protein [bacterium AH-315-G11]PCI44652.1 MAG: chromosome partitioning protein ParB [Pseudomonadota bacterium]
MVVKKTMKKRALGRGLDALLADKPTAEVLNQSTNILISKIKPNRYQPRSYFDEQELQSLTESIRKEGVLMPILLRVQGDGYELIAGERRWRASQAVGLLDIPAVVREVDDLQALELAIIENEQRDDLTAVESARAYKRLIDEFSFTQQQVAESIGVSRVQVSNLIRLLQLPLSIQDMIEQRLLTMGNARPLVGLDTGKAEALARKCVAEQWSARQMEKEAKRVLHNHTSHVSEEPIDADVAALQDELMRTLGLPVTLSCKKNGSGELRISYSRAQELDGVLRRLRTTL